MRTLVLVHHSAVSYIHVQERRVMHQHGMFLRERRQLTDYSYIMFRLSFRSIKLTCVQRSLSFDEKLPRWIFRRRSFLVPTLQHERNFKSEVWAYKSQVCENLKKFCWIVLELHMFSWYECFRHSIIRTNSFHTWVSVIMILVPHANGWIRTRTTVGTDYS